NHTVRTYLRDRDRAAIRATRPGYSPYWNPAELATRLDRPTLQQLLPAPYRRIIARRNGDPSADAIHAGWITLTVRTLMKLSPLWLGLGIVFTGTACWWEWKQAGQSRESPHRP